VQLRDFKTATGEAWIFKRTARHVLTVSWNPTTSTSFAATRTQARLVYTSIAPPETTVIVGPRVRSSSSIRIELPMGSSSSRNLNTRDVPFVFIVIVVVIVIAWTIFLVLAR